MLTRITRLHPVTIALVALLAFAGVGRAQETLKLAVCDVMRDLDTWDGKIISVYGEVLWGPDVSLATEVRCPVGPETNGLRWPSNIALLFWPDPVNPSDISSAPADIRSVQVLRRIIQLAEGTYPGAEWDAFKPPVRITASLVGRLHKGHLTRLDQTRSWGSGFGHQGVYPAMLEGIAVTEIAVTWTPKSPPPSDSGSQP